MRNPSDPLSVLSQALRSDLDEVEALIRERADSLHAERIGRIGDHILGSGGKRIRPVLALAAAKLLDYSGDHHILLAAAVEFIHTATLLHDDVVDESSQRRGRPTANLLWDNKSSVLVGDYFFARSFQLMVKTGNQAALTVLADASATIAEAEVMQLVAERDIRVGEERYLKIVNGKTAALFMAAARSGALVAGGSRDEVEALGAYGASLGIAFQIADDFLDYSGSADSLGKNIGDDFRERKVTLPVIKSIAKANAEEQDFWDRTIGRGEQDEGDFERARSFLTRSGSINAARADALSWSNAACEALEPLPATPYRDMLKDLAEFTVSRET